MSKRKIDDVLDGILPHKSKDDYFKAWVLFQQYIGHSDRPNETDYIEYFDYLKMVKDYAASTLWKTYSMLNHMHQNYFNENLQGISPQLTCQLKAFNATYEPKVTSVFTKNQLDAFLKMKDLNEEPFWILRKAMIVVAMSGGLRCAEITYLSFDNMEDHGDTYIFTVRKKRHITKQAPSVFIVPCSLSIHLDNYMLALRSTLGSGAMEGRLFKGTPVSHTSKKTRFINQPMGKNKICAMGQDVALVLKLPDPKAYTGHCFGRTSKLLTADKNGSNSAIENYLFGLKNEATAKKQGSNIKKTCIGDTKNGDPVQKYTLSNDNSVEVDIITLGGVITSLRVPNKNGDIDDVVLGFDDVPGYERSDNPYLSGIIGRCAGRITKGQFRIDGMKHEVSLNWGHELEHHSHGGLSGWDKKVWKDTIENDCLKLSLVSPDLDEGYPGEVKAEVTYELTSENELIISYKATTDTATVMNLTNHPYFNLGGHQNGNVYDHVVELFADRYQEQVQFLPTGDLCSVDNEWLDLRKPTVLGDTIGYGKKDGYDFAYELSGPTGKKYAARVFHPASGRILEVYTDQPALVFYTGNFLDIRGGKSEASYPIHSGLCLESMNFADAVNHESLPDCVLRPGSEYRHTIWYKFKTENE